MIRNHFAALENLHYEIRGLHFPQMGAFKALGFNFLLKAYTLFLSNGAHQDSRLVPSELFLISMKHCMLPLLSGIMSISYDFSLFHATFVSFSS